MLERLHEEIKRRTRVARLFPNEASPLRLVSSIEMEINEDWIMEVKVKEKKNNHVLVQNQVPCAMFFNDQDG